GGADAGGVEDLLVGEPGLAEAVDVCGGTGGGGGGAGGAGGEGAGVRAGGGRGGGHGPVLGGGGGWGAREGRGGAGGRGWGGGGGGGRGSNSLSAPGSGSRPASMAVHRSSSKRLTVGPWRAARRLRARPDGCVRRSAGGGRGRSAGGSRCTWRGDWRGSS